MTTSKQRFVKEYANYKVKLLKDAARKEPDTHKAGAMVISADYIERLVVMWQDGLVTTDDAMKRIAEA